MLDTDSFIYATDSSTADILVDTASSTHYIFIGICFRTDILGISLFSTLVEALLYRGTFLYPFPEPQEFVLPLIHF